MCYMNAASLIILGATKVVIGGAIVGPIGAIGLAKRTCNYIKGQKSDTNNKIQSIVATIFAIGAGFALSMYLPAFIPIGFGIALGLNLPHIAKIFVKNKETKEKLDNIAGVIGSIFNTLGLLPLLGSLMIL